jgi:long-chain fatty acid transport protein
VFLRQSDACQPGDNNTVGLWQLVPPLVLGLLTGPCDANNGFNLIGFGAESIGMAGSDLAVARDTSALSTNPAGLTQLPERMLNATAAAVLAVDVRHRDEFGNDEKVSNNLIGGGVSFGYASRIAKAPLVWGIGLFAQGGSGVEYKGLNTAFGTRDDLSSRFRIGKLSGGLAWAASDALSLGATYELVYADLNQEVFPDTSFADAADPANAFFGYDLKDMDDFAPGLRLGATYRVNERVRLGVAYNGKTELTLTDGRMDVNLSAIGLGRVRYRDVRASGIDRPQELGAGIAFQPTDAVLVAVELNWINWSDAVRRSEITAKDPSNPAAPQRLDVDTELNWRDQYVFAAGAAYDLTPRTVIRCGYNYGRNPIPDRHLTPLLASITQHHVTLGAGHRLSRAWRIDGALQYDLRQDAHYENRELPFGPGAEERAEVINIYIELGGSW